MAYKKKKGNKKMTTAGGRLRAAMAASGVDVLTLAAKLEVTPQIVRKWLRNNKKCAHMSATHATHSSIFLGVSVTWLTLGVGLPLRVTEVEYSEERFMQTYRRLNARHKNIIAILAALLAMEEHG